MDILSRLDLYETGRRYLLSKATRIEPKIVDVAGSDANIFVGSTSFVAAAIARQLAKNAGDLLLDSAKKEALDRYGWDRYQLLRKGASAAVGEVTFSRPNATAGSGTIGTGTKLTTLTGTEYVTTSDAIFGASTLKAKALVRSVQAGKEFQVGKNQIRKVSGVFDASITVTNEEPTAGGEPVEPDPTFRERIRKYWRTARRGTLAAIEFGALAVPGVDSAFAVEALTATAQPARVVSLYIADSSGVASAALAASVTNELEEYRCAGIAVIPSLSVPQMIGIKLKLTFLAGVETSVLSLAIRTAVVEFVNARGANQTLYYASLAALLTRYEKSGLVPADSSVLEPTADVVPTLGRTLRTTLALVELV